MDKVQAFIRESTNEMRYKVSWPKYKDLQNSSVLVLVASLILSLFIGVVDFSFENLMEWFYTAF
ncbi:MAG: preprotein translocase subunit SecE [Bacteroidetes bacterium]|nr:preprotein translocase subunit SecE [Bacteroidota bacterium]MCH8231048.1 preprotein translocase subunit SecE [Bacteroidota bacterium]